MKFLLWALIAVIAYLLGNISTGLIVGKVFAHTDIRKTGSGNTGNGGNTTQNPGAMQKLMDKLSPEEKQTIGDLGPLAGFFYGLM